MFLLSMVVVFHLLPAKIQMNEVQKIRVFDRILPVGELSDVLTDSLLEI